MNELPNSHDAELQKAEFLKLVGRNIREARRGIKKSQRALAFECGMEPASICRMEAGKGNLTISTLLKMSMALRVTPAALVSGQP
ncbi:MAG: helix-turn-helix transcriptional regulator [Bacteroidetes bacterium]|nr:helix-turn-helix transcriptional regulator [Bacteroidota bacterium]